MRHGPQRVMGKNITDVHYTRDTMEPNISRETFTMAVKMGIKTLFPLLKRITDDTNLDCFG